MQRIRRRLPPSGQALLRGRELVQASLGRRKGALDGALEMQPGTAMCGTTRRNPWGHSRHSDVVRVSLGRRPSDAARPPR